MILRLLVWEGPLSVFTIKLSSFFLVIKSLQATKSHNGASEVSLFLLSFPLIILGIDPSSSKEAYWINISSASSNRSAAIIPLSEIREYLRRVEKGESVKDLLEGKDIKKIELDELEKLANKRTS